MQVIGGEILCNYTNFSFFFVLKNALKFFSSHSVTNVINPLKPELNPICYLLALSGAHYFLHVSRIRVKSLTLR